MASLQSLGWFPQRSSTLKPRPVAFTLAAKMPAATGVGLLGP